jgi:hypothetical protein
MADLRFSQVSGPRQSLLRQCQRIGFGKIVRFSVSDGEPVVLPETEALVDVKLDEDAGPRLEQDLNDFALCAEVRRLFKQLDAIHNAVVDHLEVRAGIPRRIVFKAPILTHK